MPTQRSERSPPPRPDAGSFADYLHQCIEEERAALAREVHDDIGGALAAIRFDLDWIGRHAADAAVRSRLDAATEMLGYAIGASQRIALDLQPPMLDKGLVAAVCELAAGFERRTGIKTRIRTACSGVEPARAVQRVAFRTAQETLTNIGKHAHCSEVSIDLRTGGGHADAGDRRQRPGHSARRAGQARRARPQGGCARARVPSMAGCASQAAPAPARRWCSRCRSKRGNAPPAGRSLPA